MSSRLYLGNLAQTVDEYSLIQLCSKHGKVAKLDYLYHKVGIQKGKPRGFAFVEYSTPEVRQIAEIHRNRLTIRSPPSLLAPFR